MLAGESLAAPCDASDRQPIHCHASREIGSTMKHAITRRELLASAALVSALPETPPAIPERPLGKTGIRVPILGFGTAPFGERCTTTEAVKLIEEALSLGIRYFDTAPQESGYGQAQKQLGAALHGRRTDAFLVTKCWCAHADDAVRSLHGSLKELRTDHVDLLLAHSVGSGRMPAGEMLARGGVMAGLRKAKRDGLTRFIGISGHNRTARFVRILAETDIDVLMSAVNLVDRHTYNFEEKVWPVAAKKQIGLVAMKVFGGQWGVARSSSRMPLEHHALAFRYALSLPGASCAIVGMATSEELRQNVQRAIHFAPLTAEERQEADRIGRDLAKKWGPHFGAVV